MKWVSVCLAFLLWAGAVSAADTPPASNPQFQVRAVDDTWRSALPRDADAATRAYLDRLPPAVVARADAYFEGGYWLQLWNFLLGLVIAALMLGGRRAARVRDLAQRVGRKPFFRDALFGMAYTVAGALLAFPLTVYQGFVREHAYGMSTQTLGAWLGEQATGLAVSMVIAGPVVGVLYAVLRRVGSRWWAWATAGGTALVVLMLMMAPVWIDPLFNSYKPVEDGTVRSEVLAMAKANGVPVDNVYEFDASRQTTRISANVAGIFGSAAVRLNDNLLRRTSLPEIRAVMAHELGHYVLNHVYKMVTSLALVLAAGFLFAQWAMARLLAAWGPRWGLRGVDDVASLPLLAAVMSVFFLVATPVVNTMMRTGEIEADRFALNLSREPHGMAEALLKLTEYRKPDPRPIEEILFFDHPSIRSRIHDAMRWREAMGTP